MKRIIKNVGLYVGAIGVLASCSTKEGPESVIQTFEKFPVLTENITPLTVTEAGTYTIPIQFDERQIVDVTVSISNGESSTAVLGEDFVLSASEVSYLALSGGGTIDVTVLPDLVAEGEETIYLTFTGGNPVGSPLPQEVLVLTVRDSIYQFPALSLDWSGEIAAFPGNFWQSFIDIDLLVEDDAGAEVSGYAGATSAVPEIISSEDIPDGTYTLVANLWSNPITGNGLDDEDLPLVMTISLGGVGSAGFVPREIGLTPVWNGETPSDQDGENNLILGRVTVDGNVMTLIDGNGTLVGTFGEN